MKRRGATLVGIASAALLAADAALADGDWLTPEAFRTLTEGRVMRTFLSDGRTLFGHEEFREGGEVTWQNPDGSCMPGRWEPVAGAICYTYEGDPRTSCLRYRNEGGALLGYQWDMARNAVDWRRAGVRLERTGQGPLACPGAPVG